MKIAIVGSGYVGLVSGACMADFGHEVVCVDKDASKIAALRRGDMPFYEPGLVDILGRNLEHDRLRLIGLRIQNEPQRALEVVLVLGKVNGQSIDARTYQTIVQGIRDYFRNTGFERAVLGLSGGLDSTVVAVLLAFSAMRDGFQQTVQGSGSEAIAIVLREGSQAEINSITEQCGLAAGELFQDESEKRLLFLFRIRPSAQERACVTGWAKKNRLRTVFIEALNEPVS